MLHRLIQLVGRLPPSTLPPRAHRDATHRFAQHCPQRYHRRWMRRAASTLRRYPAQPDRLRLVLGVGRSGTTWLASSLARSPSPITYIEEPFRRIRPLPVFDSGDDPSAIAYSAAPDTPELARLNAVAGLLSAYEPGMPLFYDDVRDRAVRREAEHAGAVIVKEVHALMGAEWLLQTSGCRAIVITRRFDRLLDSLMHHTGVGSPLFRVEYAAVTRTPFLERELPEHADAARLTIDWIERQRPPRVHDLLMSGLMIMLLQAYLTRLAQQHEHVMHVRHDDLITGNPEARFVEMARFFDIEPHPDAHRHSGRAHTSRSIEQLVDRTDKFMTAQDWRWIEELRARVDLTDAPNPGGGV